MHSIIWDERGRLVPLVRPKHWLAASVKRSCDRTDRIMRSRKQRKARLATTQWMNEVDRRGIAELEATGIAWAAVRRWLNEVRPAETFMSRLFLKQVLLVLSDDQLSPRERFEPGASFTSGWLQPPCRLRTAASPAGRTVVVPDLMSSTMPRRSVACWAAFSLMDATAGRVANLFAPERLCFGIT